MPVGWFVALRFMWEQRWQNVLIVSGVGVGVGVLVFISALMGGLQSSLVERTTGSQAHVVVTPLELEGRPILREPPGGGTALLRRIERPVQRMNTLPDWRKLDSNIAALSGVAAPAPIAAGPALALRGSTERGVAVIGADPDRLDRIIAVAKNLTQGSYAVNGTDVVLGMELARNLGIGVGDRLRIKTARGDGQMFIVRGLVDMGNQAANKAWALMSLRNAQTLLDLGGAATAVYVKVDDLYRADIAARRIEKLTGLTSKSWMETNAQLLTALRSQTASTTMIRFFVLITVAIGIASVLVVSVIQRSKEIGILRAMGVTRGGILRVFLLQGGLIGLLGSGVGCGLGAALSLLFQALLHNSDGTPFFPFSLSPQLFASAAGIALLSGVVAALLPAIRASRLDPAEAMRHG
jgi:lipoprotein-releasing system permease protein